MSTAKQKLISELRARDPSSVRDEFGPADPPPRSPAPPPCPALATLDRYLTAVEERHWDEAETALTELRKMAEPPKKAAPVV
jgi:hypothetical protein